MKKPSSLARRAPVLGIRTAHFEDVADLLRLVTRAVAHACRAHYDAAQRAVVCATYVETLFVDVLGPFDTLAAELGGRLVGFAQLDASTSRLRALFVDADVQGQGLGRALLAEIEARAGRRGCARVHGAMSLNAVPFYTRAGYTPLGGEERLTSQGLRVPIVRMEKRLRP